MLSNVQAGDLCIAYGRSVTTSVAVPTGFTALKTFYSEENGPMWCAYRMIIAGDASANFNQQAGAVNYVTILAAFRPDVPIGGLVIQSTQHVEPTSGDPGDITVTPTGTPGVVFACYQSSAAVDPRGFSPAKDAEQTAVGANNIYMAWKVYNSSPSAVTISMDDEGTLNSLFGGYIAVV